MDISQIDQNFSVKRADESGFLFRDVKYPPFSLEGLPWFEENHQAYYRLPLRYTEKEINSHALTLCHHTSGVCLRFRSDSPELKIRARLAYSCDMSHMPRAGSAGFDSYRKMPGEKLLHIFTILPSPGQVDLLAQIGSNPEGKLCEWVINFPLYGGVEQVEIGFREGSRLLPPRPHKVEAPVLFYGSSITQGGCASRPGNTYSAMLCRKVDAEQINLGFAGSGRGEIAVAAAIASLKLSAFVMDYDHNAPDPEYLEKTHEPFFRRVRKSCPDLPVIFMSMCDFRSRMLHNPSGGYIRRRQIIRDTYEHALASGDRLVYFIDGEKLFGNEMHDACMVDGCHPNDLGFYRMYKHVLPVLRKALKAGREGKRYHEGSCS